MAPVDPDWIHGASDVEVVVFRLGPGSPGDGSGLWKEDISDLKADLEEADFRLAHEVTRSLWLERYRELLAESLEGRKASPNGAHKGIQVRTFAELSELPDAEVHWIAYRFLAATAVTDLSAFIKAGKSTLSAQLITAICHGTEFLGEYPVEKGAVVLLTEEPPASIREAFQDAGLTTADPLYVMLWTENDHVPWAQAVTAAADLCERVGARVLVVDTLGQWANVEDENDASQARDAMAPLLSAAGRGLAVEIVRQSRKSGGEIHNAGRGSGAFGGAASILLHLDYKRQENGHFDETSTVRQLRIKSRLEREEAPPMELDYRDGRYLLLNHQPRMGSGIHARKTEDRIYEHLLLHPLLQPVAIAEALALKRATVRSGLMRLKNLGQIRIQNGFYEAVASPVASLLQPVAESRPVGYGDPLKGAPIDPATGTPSQQPDGSSSSFTPVAEVICPICGSLLIEIGPSPGELKCLGCRWVWSPEPPDQDLTERPAD